MQEQDHLPPATQGILPPTKISHASFPTPWGLYSCLGFLCTNSLSLFTYLLKICRAPEKPGPCGRKAVIFFSDAGEAVFLRSHVFTDTHFYAEDGIVCKNVRSGAWGALPVGGQAPQLLFLGVTLTAHTYNPAYPNSCGVASAPSSPSL